MTQPLVARVVAGVDGRDGGWDALALARWLAAIDGAALTVVCAYPTITMQHAPLVWRDIAVESDAARILEAAQGRLGADADARLSALAGSTPGSTLQGAAAAADLIVIGVTRRAAAARALGDDVAAQTLDHPPCPVAIAPRGLRDRDLRLVRIGVAVDGSTQCDAAVRWAGRLERRAGLRRAIEPVDVPGDATRPAEVVAALAAATAGLDVLVLATHGRGPVGRLWHGAVARDLARVARCPLIAVPIAPPG